ncbi:MAG: flavodoxin FldA [Cyanothece sp. SIO2G6]|nr:flavodoxin FldA [Cyanothece sp. SIO2G6]
MAKVGLFYGSTTGNTASAAEKIQAALGGDSVVEVFDMANAQLSDLLNYDYLIIGSPTWNVGDLQDDWEAVIDEFDGMDFSGKTVAYFGTGDSVGYADNFMDAVGILEEKITGLGGKTVGMWSTADYDFSESRAVRGDKFCGLALDEDNESEKTDDRITNWTAQVKSEMSL